MGRCTTCRRWASPMRTIGRRTFHFDRQIVVMGIVNRTPDCSRPGSDLRVGPGRRCGAGRGRAGAGWVDIGGLPFSPDAAEVSEAEELDRVVPVVDAVAAASDVVISVDTFRPRSRPAAWQPGRR